MYLGGASLSWVSDYAQIYFVDVTTPHIAGIEALGADDFARGYHVAPEGLAVYTQDCLRQEVRIALYDALPPVEPSVAHLTFGPHLRLGSYPNVRCKKLH